MTLLARKIEIDVYQKLREVFPNSQCSIDNLANAVDYNNGKLMRVWFDMWSEEFPGARLYASYSRHGETETVSVLLEKD